MVRGTLQSFLHIESFRPDPFHLHHAGIAFLAQMTFSAPGGGGSGGQPPTPLSSRLTLEDLQRPLLSRTITPENTAHTTQEREKIMASPFKPPVGNNTDLCLSLESLRGRKIMRLRGVEEIPEGEIGCDVDAQDGDQEDDAVRV